MEQAVFHTLVMQTVEALNQAGAVDDVVALYREDVQDVVEMFRSDALDVLDNV